MKAAVLTPAASGRRPAGAAEPLAAGQPARAGLPALVREGSGYERSKVRAAAIRALAALDGPEAVETLRPALEDREGEVREAAAEALTALAGAARSRSCRANETRPVNGAARRA